MMLNIEEFKETIEVNGSDMENDTALINELVINDLMVALGYNKRKDKSVKRLYNSNIDWIVADYNIKLAVKVLPLNTDIESTDLQSLYEDCASKLLSILLVTNGETVNIMRYQKETHLYKYVDSIKLTTELSESQEKILEAISKEKYNLSYIDDLLNKSVITYDELANSIKDNKDKFRELVVSVSGVEDDYIDGLVDQMINALVTKEFNDTVNTTSTELLDELQVKLNNEVDKANDLQIKLDNYATKIVELQEEVNKLRSENEVLNAESTELKIQLETLKSIQEVPAENISINNDDIESYIAQIEDMTNKHAKAMDEVTELREEIKNYKAQIDKLSGAERKKALELLSIIEDSDDMDRSYVGVINEELLSFEELHTFVGRVIQRLYELKNYEASNFIFNAELFQLVQPAVRNDLIMNNKAYDINLDGMSEDVALNKLRFLFNKFSDLVFECKKIGVLRHQNSNIEASSTDLTEINDSEFSQGFEGDVQGNWEEVDNETSKNSLFESSEDVFEDELDDNVPNKDNNYLVVQNLLNIDSLVWTDEQVTFNTIKYIGNQDVTFAISLSDGSTYDMLLSKCIDAILAIEAYSGNTAIIPELKHKDFSFINNSIKTYTEEYRNYPRINGTRYAIVDVSSVQQVATILLDICNNLNISTDLKFLYFDVNTDSKIIINEYGFNEDSVQLRETDYFKASNDDKNTYAVIRGDMFNNIMVTQNSLKAHKDIIGITSDIKTKYLIERITCIEDVQNIIGKIVEHAYESDININYNAIGNIIDTGYRIVSDDEGQVSENHKCVMLGGQPIYISEMEYWQVPYTLIKLHTSLFNNTAIALRTDLNVSAINYYGRSYETTEPSLCLAIRSFVEYMTNCVKNS